MMNFLILAGSILAKAVAVVVIVASCAAIYAVECRTIVEEA